MYSLEESFKKLVELQDKAISNGNLNAAIRIEVLKGKMTGIYDKKPVVEDNYHRKIKVEIVSADKNDQVSPQSITNN